MRISAIVLDKQSLSVAAPSTALQLAEHISLLSSRSDTRRRESLGYLANLISARPTGSPPQLVVAILPKLAPLILDRSNSVRAQVVKLFHVLAKNEGSGQVYQLLPYIRSGILHLAADIRDSSLDMLAWALDDRRGDDLVTCAGGWFQTMKAFLLMLGWAKETQSSGWSSSGRSRVEGRELAKALKVLTMLLHAGLAEIPREKPPSKWGWPYWQSEPHMLPSRSNAYAHLNLFGPPLDEENCEYGDREERQKVFHRRFQAEMEKALETSVRQGGEVGRCASAAQKNIAIGMTDFEEAEW